MSVFPDDAVFGHGTVQHREPLLALAAADDLADPRCEHVHRGDGVPAALSRT
jgi:hypothetical protein